MGGRDVARTEAKMNFSVRKLGVLSYHDGFTLWIYQAGAECAVTLSQNFFGSASNLFTKGDIIMVSASDGAINLFVEDAAYSKPVMVCQMIATPKKGDS